MPLRPLRDFMASQAYDILSDSEQRAEYDDALRRVGGWVDGRVLGGSAVAASAAAAALHPRGGMERTDACRDGPCVVEEPQTDSEATQGQWVVRHWVGADQRENTGTETKGAFDRRTPLLLRASP